jgi:hypothetical protein
MKETATPTCPRPLLTRRQQSLVDDLQVLALGAPRTLSIVARCVHVVAVVVRRRTRALGK